MITPIRTTAEVRTAHNEHPLTVRVTVVGVMVDDPTKCRGYLIAEDTGQDFGSADAIRDWPEVLRPGQVAIRQIALPIAEWERIERLARR